MVLIVRHDTAQQLFIVVRACLEWQHLPMQACFTGEFKIIVLLIALET
jgi:hypothetical protein